MVERLPRRAQKISNAYSPEFKSGLIFPDMLPIHVPSGVGSTEYYLEHHVPKTDREAFAVLIRLAVPVAEMHAIIEQRGGFYPRGWEKPAIVAAARRDPAILDPYTLVDEIGGRLVPTAFHRHPLFRRQVSECSDILRIAARFSQHDGQKWYLRSIADLLVEGKFDEIVRAWVELPDDMPLRVQIGCFESYGDKVFGRKRAPQLILGVPDRDLSKRYLGYLNFVRQTLGYSAEELQRIRLDAILDYCTAGGMARWLFNYEVLPNSEAEVGAFGARIIALHNSHREYLQEVILPAITKHIHPEALKRRISTREYVNVRSLLVMGEEFGHLTFRLPDARARLSGAYDFVNEAVARLVILADLSQLYTHQRIKEKTFQAALVSQIASTWGDYDEHVFDSPDVLADPLQLTAHQLQSLIIYSRLVRHRGIELDEDRKLVAINSAEAAQSLLAAFNDYLAVYRASTESDARVSLLNDARYILSAPRDPDPRIEQLEGSNSGEFHLDRTSNQHLVPAPSV